MWITDRLAAAEIPTGAVGILENDGANYVVNSGKSVPIGGVLAPYGYFSKPPVGTNAAALPCENGFVLGGAVGDFSDQVEPGEVLIKSGGGGYIKLKSSGEIELNGLVITADGKLILPAGEE